MILLDRKLTTAAVARRLGCSVAAVRSWRDARCKPGLFARKALAKLLRVRLDELDDLLKPLS